MGAPLIYKGDVIGIHYIFIHSSIQHSMTFSRAVNSFSWSANTFLRQQTYYLTSESISKGSAPSLRQRITFMIRKSISKGSAPSLRQRIIFMISEWSSCSANHLHSSIFQISWLHCCVHQFDALVWIHELLFILLQVLKKICKDIH